MAGTIVRISDSTRLTQASLRGFVGDSLRRFKSIFPNVVYTRGTIFVAESAGAYWLLEAIGYFLCSTEMKQAIERDERLASFQFWRLAVATDKSAILSARASVRTKPFLKYEIPSTDFPLSYVRIWAEYEKNEWKLRLPSEQ